MHRERAAAIVLTGVLAAWPIGCGSDSGGHGANGQSCYPDGTCNAGLMCLSRICVPTGSGGAGGDVGGNGGAAAGAGGGSGTGGSGGATGGSGGATAGTGGATGGGGGATAGASGATGGG